MTEPTPRLRPPWFRRLHWRLMGAYALIIIPVIAVLVVFINHRFETYLMERTQDALSHEAKIVVQMMTHDRTGDWDALADEIVNHSMLGSPEGRRVTLIDAEGRVIGDSEVSGDALIGLDSHNKRPEVAEALQGEQGVAVRYSQTLRRELIYVARKVPNLKGHRDPAVVRLASSLEAHEALIGEVRFVLLMAGVATILALMLAVLLISRIVSRPLAELSADARRIAVGEENATIKVERDDELGVLAESINELSSQLTRKLAQTHNDKMLLSTILDSMTEGVIVCDRVGTVVLINPVARKLLSTGEGEAEGRLLLEVYRSPDLGDTLDEAMAQRAAISRELMIMHRRDMLNLMVEAAPLLRGEEVWGAVAVLRDNTTLRQLERVRRDFVANVSHELRTPLATITGYAETLLSGVIELDPMGREFVETIERHVKRLNVLVADLLIIARLEASGEKPELVCVGLREVMAEVLDAVHMGSQERDIELRVKLKAERVMADTRALTQILRNLVENGIHYSDPGGQVWIEARSAPGGRVTIRVEDKGIGIEAQHLPRIFERFYRVDEGRSRDVGGTGLGLAIVKHIVQAMGGTIDVKSKTGKGSVFTVTLLAPPETPEA